jgi:hypothetical protein
MGHYKANAQAFHAMVAMYVKQTKAQPSQFVKKLIEMPKIDLPPSTPKKKDLALVE